MNLAELKVKPGPSIMLTPFLDVLTVLLIFLIANFSPDDTHVELSSKIKLPDSIHHLDKVPHLQVEVAPGYLKINGTSIEGLVPEQENAQAWKNLKKYFVENTVSKTEPVLLIADKETSFRFIDRAAAHLSAEGFSDLYFQTNFQEAVQ
jgi:biopolymer transport protein ExbD